MYYLDFDHDGHWYIIPHDKRNDFNNWLDSSDYYEGVTPSFAKIVEGSEKVVFKEYEIK